MSYFKAGDLVFMSEAQNQHPDPSAGSVSTIFQGIYLRELTSGELSTYSLSAPASWVTFPSVLSSLGTPLEATWSSGANSVLVVNDAKIIGAVHTGIDPALLASVTPVPYYTP